jgi:hypothetical protein
VVRAFGKNESQLKGLVTNFRTVTGSFAAQDQALEQAVAELPAVLDAAKPAFANLNASFPGLRAFSREALPGVRSTNPMIEASTPFIEQLRLLMSEDELRGLTHDLRPTIPDLAKLAHETIPFLHQTRALSSCFNEVVIPWANSTVDPQNPAYPANLEPSQPDGPMTVAEETGYGLLGIAGESQGGDANGQTIRVEAGGGNNTIVAPGSGTEFGEAQASIAPGQVLGSMPKVFPAHGNTSTADSVKPRFKPNSPCERQEPPNLGAAGGPAPSGQQPLPVPNSAQQLSSAVADLDPATKEQLQDFATLSNKANPSAADVEKLTQLQDELTKAFENGVGN